MSVRLQPLSLCPERSPVRLGRIPVRVLASATTTRICLRDGSSADGSRLTPLVWTSLRILVSVPSKATSSHGQRPRPQRMMVSVRVPSAVCEHPLNLHQQPLKTGASSKC